MWRFFLIAGLVLLGSQAFSQQFENTYFDQYSLIDKTYRISDCERNEDGAYEFYVTWDVTVSRDKQKRKPEENYTSEVPHGALNISFSSEATCRVFGEIYCETCKKVMTSNLLGMFGASSESMVTVIWDYGAQALEQAPNKLTTFTYRIYVDTDDPDLRIRTRSANWFFQR